MAELGVLGPEDLTLWATMFRSGRFPGEAE
jgi:hypothetical protein